MAAQSAGGSNIQVVNNSTDMVNMDTENSNTNGQRTSKNKARSPLIEQQNKISRLTGFKKSLILTGVGFQIKEKFGTIVQMGTALKKNHFENFQQIKPVKNGGYLIEFSSEKDYDSFLKITTIENKTVKIVIPTSEEQEKWGVIKIDTEVSCDEIRAEVPDAVDIYRFQRKDGQTLRQVKLKFEKEVPKSVDIGGIRYFTEKYIPTPRQCFHCLRFGHTTFNCRYEAKCGKCAGNHTTEKCNVHEIRCINCDRMHEATDRNCSVYKKEKYIKKISIIDNIPVLEARKKVENQSQSNQSKQPFFHNNSFDSLSGDELINPAPTNTNYDKDFPEHRISHFRKPPKTPQQTLRQTQYKTPIRTRQTQSEQTPKRSFTNLHFPAQIDINEVGSPSFANVVSNKLSAEEISSIKCARKLVYNFSRILKFVISVALEYDGTPPPNVLQPISKDISDFIFEIINQNSTKTLTLSEQDLNEIIFSK